MYCTVYCTVYFPVLCTFLCCVFSCTVYCGTHWQDQWQVVSWQTSAAAEQKETFWESAWQDQTAGHYRSVLCPVYFWMELLRLKPVSLVTKNNMLRWLGQVKHNDDAYWVKWCMKMESEENRKTWKTCGDYVEQDMNQIKSNFIKAKGQYGHLHCSIIHCKHYIKYTLQNLIKITPISDCLKAP